MRDAQQPGHVSLNTLLHRLKDGRYLIPDFQREFEWEARDIRDLVRSIFRDYYIGSLLLWKGTPENFKALSCEPIYGFSGKQDAESIVLDGQQRLTALYYAFVAPNERLPGKSSRAFFFVRLDRFIEEDSDDAFDYRWDDRSWSGIADTEARQYQNHVFPMSVIGRGGFALANWAQGYSQFWQNKRDAAEDAKERDNAERHIENAAKFSEVLLATTEQYQISYVELAKDLETEKICNIFTQINSKGIRLDIFDLINAMLKPRGLQLKSMWREAQVRLDASAIDKLNVYVLQVMSILQQTYCSPKYLYYLLPGQTKVAREHDGSRRQEVLIADAKQFKHEWDGAVEALHGAIKLLHHPQEYGVTKPSYLPYKTILPVFAALQSKIAQLEPEARLDAQRKFRIWYWASVFTNHYSASSESTSARDYAAVLAWIDGGAEPLPVATLKNEFASLPLEMETKPGSSRYNGVFNLLVINGAKDWVTGLIPQAGDLHDHHIIPRSWGMKQAGVGDRINTILNRCPLTADTNCNVISDRLPNAYLPDLITRNGESKVREILQSHLISGEAFDILMRHPFGPSDFDAFIAERKRTIVSAIEAELLAERLDLPSNLRTLDREIERIELVLRGLVAANLNNLQELPGDLPSKIETRIAGARRNAAIDSSRFDEMSDALEFADLRELQAAICATNLWSRFESIFVNKTILAAKFDQLANLRNGIRHSRSVDQVTEMEGHAACIWFDNVIGKTFSADEGTALSTSPANETLP